MVDQVSEVSLLKGSLKKPGNIYPNITGTVNYTIVMKNYPLVAMMQSGIFKTTYSLPRMKADADISGRLIVFPKAFKSEKKRQRRSVRSE